MKEPLSRKVNYRMKLMNLAQLAPRSLAVIQYLALAAGLLNGSSLVGVVLHQWVWPFLNGCGLSRMPLALMYPVLSHEASKYDFYLNHSYCNSVAREKGF